MMTNDQPTWRHSNQYSADSACVHCEGVVRHESWCSTQCAIVHYAHQATVFPSQLSFADHLILHALGVTWSEDSIPPKRRSVPGDLA